MKTNQQTLKKEIHFSGIGLHTGKSSEIKLKPASINYGIRFRRTDLKVSDTIPASVEMVIDTSRGTTLSNGVYSIQTVEHLLAALAGLQVDNALVEVDGPEIPILDGSAKNIVDGMINVGLIEQVEKKTFYTIQEPFHYSSDDGSVIIEAEPAEVFELTVEIDYDSSIIGPQNAALKSFGSFADEIAPARTFCFLHEVETLYQTGMIKGGDLNNAVVITERPILEGEFDHLARLMNMPTIPAQKAGVLNSITLRYENEPARHKLLDMIGDLSLLGQPVLGKIKARKPGHTANVAFVKMIRDIITQPVN